MACCRMENTHARTVTHLYVRPALLPTQELPHRRLYMHFIHRMQYPVPDVWKILWCVKGGCHRLLNTL